MTILVFCVALFAGIILGYIIGKRSKSSDTGQNTEQLISLSNANASLKTQVEMLEQQVIEEKRRAQESLQRQRDEFRQEQAEQAQRFKEAEDVRRADSKAQLEQQLELVKTQLTQQTEQSNRESITEIMRPYREQLEQLKQQNVEDRATLQGEIKRFVETGGRLTREADRLVTALSGSVTIQGNLGEKLLSDLLAGSGLIEGKQYILQKTVRNEDGTTAKNSSGKKVRPGDTVDLGGKKISVTAK